MMTATLPLAAWLLVVALSVLAGAGAMALAMWPRDDTPDPAAPGPVTAPLPAAGRLMLDPAPPDDLTRWDIPVTWSEVRAQQDDVIRFAAEYGGLR